MKSYLDDIRKCLIYIFFVLCMILGTIVVKADDPNLRMPCANLPMKQNVNDIKAIFREIRTMAAHPEMNYIRLHDKERDAIIKKLPSQPELELFLR